MREGGNEEAVAQGLGAEKGRVIKYFRRITFRHTTHTRHINTRYTNKPNKSPLQARTRNPTGSDEELGGFGLTRLVEHEQFRRHCHIRHELINQLQVITKALLGLGLWKVERQGNLLDHPLETLGRCQRHCEWLIPSFLSKKKQTTSASLKNPLLPNQACTRSGSKVLSGKRPKRPFFKPTFQKTATRNPKCKFELSSSFFSSSFPLLPFFLFFYLCMSILHSYDSSNLWSFGDDDPTPSSPYTSLTQIWPLAKGRLAAPPPAFPTFLKTTSAMS